MRKFTNTNLAVTTIAIILLIGSGIGYAYWTTGGDGTGSATSGASTSLAVHQTGALAPMFPGDSAQSLSGNFDNTSDGPFTVSSVTVSISSVTGGTPALGCTAADYTLAGAAMSVPQSVAVGTGVGTWSGATIKFNNTGANQDACQGATVNFAYEIA